MNALVVLCLVALVLVQNASAFLNARPVMATRVLSRAMAAGSGEVIVYSVCIHFINLTITLLSVAIEDHQQGQDDVHGQRGYRQAIGGCQA